MPKSTGGTSTQHPQARGFDGVITIRRAEFPYALLRQESRRRNKDDPEFELEDTGAFEGDRYWQITADYAKASPDDVCMRISVRNAGSDPAELDALPTLWFRNRWSWEAGAARPIIRATAENGNVGAIAEEELVGPLALHCRGGSDWNFAVAAVL